LIAWNKTESWNGYSFQTGQYPLSLLWNEMDLSESVAITIKLTVNQVAHTRFQELNTCLHPCQEENLSLSSTLLMHTHKSHWIKSAPRSIPTRVSTVTIVCYLELHLHIERTMENILQGLPHICIYIDDILVTGSTTDKHLSPPQPGGSSHSFGKRQCSAN
jgi:hypothetical protein